MANSSIRFSFARPAGLLIIISAGLFATTAFVSAGDPREEAVMRDRKRIEGAWRIVALEVNGTKTSEEDLKPLRVVNSLDGGWSLLADGMEISRGTSTIDPTQKIKTIDFTPSVGEGKGELHLGIYELGETTRKMCFNPPGKGRPAEFTSPPGSERILVTFELEKEAAVKRDRQRIEGTWRIVALEIDGKKAAKEDARKLTVQNGPDGAWTIFAEGNIVIKGTSTIDPLKKPRTLDFTPTEGAEKGNLHLGIYELGETTRKLCFAPSGKERPTEFVSTPGSERILVTFEREKTR